MPVYKKNIMSFERLENRINELSLEFYIYRLLKQAIPNIAIIREYQNIFDLYIKKSFVKKHKGKPIYIEIKQRITNSSIRHIENLLEKIQNNKNGVFRIIVQEEINYPENIKLKNVLKKYSNIDVKIWNIGFLRRYLQKYYSHVNDKKLYDEYTKNPTDFLIQSKILYTDKKDYSKIIFELLNENKITLFLGAGVSYPSKLPNWKELITRLLDKIVPSINGLEKLISEKKAQTCKMIIKDFGNNPLTQIRYLKSAMKQSCKENFNELLRESLYRKKPNPNTELLNSIRELLNKFNIKDILTYNLDNILELNFKKNNIKCKSLTKSSCIRDPNKLNIYHIHGLITLDRSELNDIIFSEEEYHKSYSYPYDWTNTTQLHFLRSSIGLFIGCSLTDPNTRRILDTVNEEQEEKYHYAFMFHKSIKKSTQEHEKIYIKISKAIKDIFYNSIGIRVIWVDNYNKIPKMLKNFARLKSS